MTALAGRAWGWLRSWSGRSDPRQQAPAPAQGQKRPARGSWTSWMWGGWSGQAEPAEQYWEAPEKLQQVEVSGSGWWSGYLPASSLWSGGSGRTGPRRRQHGGRGGDPWDRDGDTSDYGTPPPSPPPAAPSSPLTSPFRLFVRGWTVDVVPEHYEICFNFLRHLFDLLVVGFLWTVSPPAKLVLEVLGVQGPLRLWFHGMAMFLVSTVGMAGLLWLIQEYLPQFALVYGIVQAAVISVSVRQSVVLGVDEEEGDRDPADQAGDGEERLASDEQEKMD